MATATRQALKQESLTVFADAGYSNGAHATACERDGIVVCVPRQLVRKQLHRKKRNVTYMSPNCTGCALKPRCTTADRRCLKRHLDDDALNRMSDRATPEMMIKRRCAAEYPFGILKRMAAGGRFLTRNLSGTSTEMALSVLAYNILRAINLKAPVA